MAEIATLGEAWRAFWHKRAPWIIAVVIVAAVTLRIALGAFTWRDAVAAALMLVIYPFGEWTIHVYLLHLPPFSYGGRKIELASARSHRMHHEEPHRLDLVNFAPLEAVGVLLVAVPLVVGVGALVALALPGPLPFEPVLTAVVVAYVLVGVYEWTHFLIHTKHRPRSRLYRAVWRNHRLHHFKNEHYWHGITNTLSDRVLGTHPDHRDVPRSPTARTLRPGQG